MTSLVSLHSSVWAGLAVAASLLAAAPAASAADCGDDAAGFDAWLARLKRTAVTQGISPAAVTRRSPASSYDPDRDPLSTARSARSSSPSREFYARVSTGPRSAAAGPDAHARRPRSTGSRSDTACRRSILVRHLGPGDQLRLRQQRQILGHALARDAGLRLPPHGLFHRASARCAAHRRARRPQSGSAARRLGRRDRSHAVHAIRLLASAQSISTATDGATSRPALPTCWRPRPISSKVTAGRPRQGWEPGSANYAVIKDWNKAEVYQRTIAVMAFKLAESRSP